MTSFLNRRFKPSFGISEKDPYSQKLHSLKLVSQEVHYQIVKDQVAFPAKGSPFTGERQILGETSGLSTAHFKNLAKLFF